MSTRQTFVSLCLCGDIPLECGTPYVTEAVGNRAEDRGDVERFPQPRTAGTLDEFECFGIHQVSGNEDNPPLEGCALSFEGGVEFRTADLGHFDIADNEIEFVSIN
jgi:hypothetical protein